MADKAPNRQHCRNMNQLLAQFYLCSKLLENALICNDEMIVNHIIGLQQHTYFYLCHWLKYESDRVAGSVRIE